jgi:hypothetical protein
MNIKHWPANTWMRKRLAMLKEREAEALYDQAVKAAGEKET